MAASVKITGVPQMQASLAAVAAKLEALESAAVASETVAIKDDAQGMARVDTGELRDGIKASAKGTRGQVESTARHSPFNEFGTSRMPAQPFMGPAADGSRARFVGRAAAAVRKATA